MLSLVDSRGGTSRRAFLRIGSLAFAGLALPDLLRASAAYADGIATGKSVIFLHCSGGPPQQETFDPKMSAPAGVRSVTGEIPTKLAGITFGSTMEKLAARADRLAIVRSFRSGDGNHDIKPVVSKASLGANLGSIIARIVGATDAKTGMPTTSALFPRAVDPKSMPNLEQFGKFDSAGSLGQGYVPFVPGGGGQLQKDMQLALPMTRIDDRRNLLAGLDRLKRQLDTQGEGLDRFREQAFDTILGGVADAFDLSREDKKTIELYDTAPLVEPSQISRRWNNHGRYVDHSQTLGKLLLLARRLCESGCQFVTISTNFVWDFHADANNAGVDEGMRYAGLPMDHAVSALIDDLQDRGLDKKILLVATGEMGRTPRLNAKGGRDHWGGLTPLLLAGGGLAMGQVIGQSDKSAAEPATDPVDINQLIATIMHTVLDMGKVRLLTGLPQDMVRAINAAQPIEGLM